MVVQTRSNLLNDRFRDEVYLFTYNEIEKNHGRNKEKHALLRGQRIQKIMNFSN